MLDTRDFWIHNKREALTTAIGAVDVVTMNEGEARTFAGTYGTLTAAKAILNLGPRIVIIKQGEYGCAMVGEDGYFSAPACPLEDVKDPTGAGDALSAGLIKALLDNNVNSNNLHKLPINTFIEVLLRAQAAGAICVTGIGATTTVTKNNQEKLLRKQGNKIRTRVKQERRKDD